MTQVVDNSCHHSIVILGRRSTFKTTTALRLMLEHIRANYEKTGKPNRLIIASTENWWSEADNAAPRMAGCSSESEFKKLLSDSNTSVVFERVQGVVGDIMAQQIEKHILEDGITHILLDCMELYDVDRQNEDVDNGTVLQWRLEFQKRFNGQVMAVMNRMNPYRINGDDSPQPDSIGFMSEGNHLEYFICKDDIVFITSDNTSVPILKMEHHPERDFGKVTLAVFDDSGLLTQDLPEADPIQQTFSWINQVKTIDEVFDNQEKIKSITKKDSPSK